VVVCILFVLYKYSIFLSTLKVKGNHSQNRDKVSVVSKTIRLPSVHVVDVGHKTGATPSSSLSIATSSSSSSVVTSSASTSEQVVTVVTKGPPIDPPVLHDNNYESLLKLRDQVATLNEKETVLNAGKYPPLGPDGLVMIVQVHRRTEYLKILIESLGNVRDIEKVLVVFSFDYYDKELFDIVEKITFCKV